jgi:excisionase family DNA binding protein
VSFRRIQSWRAPVACISLFKKGADTLLKSNEAYKLIFREYPDVVNVEQMCDMLGGISAKTAYRLLRQNQIKHFKIGRTYKIPKLHIFEYLAVAQESDA